MTPIETTQRASFYLQDKNYFTILVQGKVNSKTAEFTFQIDEF